MPLNKQLELTFVGPTASWPGGPRHSPSSPFRTERGT
jgi:hypothetical protein